MDVLRFPLVGPFLRWRHSRTLLQFGLLAVAAAVVVHGLFGPDIAPRNLSTVLTSIHWRGLLVVSVVVLGNLFCTACPMILVRDAGRRIVPPRFTWPRRLRRKWLALALLVLVLFSYELFDLWEAPAATAWLVSLAGRDERLPINGEITRIGSAPDNDIVLAGLSPNHAEIRRESGRYLIYDLGSRRTWVNDVQVAAVHMLKDGFRLQLGSSGFVFQTQST